jgi:hypothetical protein
MMLEDRDPSVDLFDVAARRRAAPLGTDESRSSESGDDEGGSDEDRRDDANPPFDSSSRFGSATSTRITSRARASALTREKNSVAMAPARRR